MFEGYQSDSFSKRFTVFCNKHEEPKEMKFVQIKHSKYYRCEESKCGAAIKVSPV